MSDIRTTSQEFLVSGSLVTVKDTVEATIDNDTNDAYCNCHESVIFLTKKINELVEEVNRLKNQ